MVKRNNINRQAARPSEDTLDARLTAAIDAESRLRDLIKDARTLFQDMREYDRALAERIELGRELLGGFAAIVNGAVAKKGGEIDQRLTKFEQAEKERTEQSLEKLRTEVNARVVGKINQVTEALSKFVENKQRAVRRRLAMGDQEFTVEIREDGGIEVYRSDEDKDKDT